MNDSQYMTRMNESGVDRLAVYDAIEGAVLARVPDADLGLIYDLFYDGCNADEIIAELQAIAAQR